MILKRILALLTALLFILSVFTGCELTGPEESAEESEDKPLEKCNLSLGTSYNYSNINSANTFQDEGFVLTKEGAENEKGSKVILQDVAIKSNDWSGNAHDFSLFDDHDPYYYIENDFGFPADLEKSVILFGDGGEMPVKVELFYSNDGYNYSFYAGEMTHDGNGTFTYEFSAPVLAKSVKYLIYGALDKVTNPKAIQNIGTPRAKRVNLSKGMTYEVKGKASEKHTAYANAGTILTDGVFSGKTLQKGNIVAVEPSHKDALMNRNMITVKFDLGEERNLSEVYLYTVYMDGVGIGDPEFINVKYSTDGINFEDFSMGFVNGSFKLTSYTRNVYRAMRNCTVKARYVNVNIYTSKPVFLEELELYGSAEEVKEPEYVYPEITDYSKYPIIRGGFYAFFIDYIAGYNPHHYYDEYRTYLQLKGFRELGMDTIIIGGESLSYEKKITLIEPPAELAAKGYRKGVGHGVYDLNEAILNSGDRLGMNIYVSTVSSRSYSELQGNRNDKKEYVENVLADAEIMIRYLYGKYRDHPSFYGFYFTDETCDYWLQQERGAMTTFTRMLYEGQSKVIRSLNDKLAIAIAPAAWRSDTPEKFGESLYNLIKNKKEGGRPIIDYVFMQDCLGRFETITVPENMYARYQEYLSACREGVEKAGGVFGNDIEIFDQTYHIKSYDEIVKSLECESSYTEYNLVYDLAHYFSSSGRGNVNNYQFTNNDHVYCSYVKRLWNLLKK